MGEMSWGETSWGEMSFREKCHRGENYHREKCHGEKRHGEKCYRGETSLGRNAVEPFLTPFLNCEMWFCISKYFYNVTSSLP